MFSKQEMIKEIIGFIKNDFSKNFDLLRSLEKVELLKMRDDLIYWRHRLDGLTEDQIYERTRVLKL